MDEQAEALAIEPIDLGAVAPERRPFLRAFSESGVIAHACRAAGICRNTHYNWLRDDPTYAKVFAEAQEHATDLLEHEALRRAREGVRRPVLYQGEQVTILNPETGKQEPLFEHAYSDVLAIFLLKGRRREKYGDQTKIDQTTDLRGSLVMSEDGVPDWFKERSGGAGADDPQAG